MPIKTIVHIEHDLDMLKRFNHNESCLIIATYYSYVIYPLSRMRFRKCP